MDLDNDGTVASAGRALIGHGNPAPGLRGVPPEFQGRVPPEQDLAALGRPGCLCACPQVHVRQRLGRDHDLHAPQRDGRRAGLDLDVKAELDPVTLHLSIMETSAKRGARYARISEDQIGDGHGVANQLADQEAHAQRRGIRITATYSDNDISATYGAPRPGYIA